VYHTHRSLYDRSMEKTPEQVFISSLRKDFELSPAESQGVLELAKECLFGDIPKTLGKVKVLCASVNAKHGKPLSEQEMTRVELTLDKGVEDLDVLRREGAAALRQLKVLRITEEAWDQEGLLTQEDIGRILQVSERTIRSDIKDLIKDGNTVHTRGYDHDIGRSVSHKSRIVELYLQGYTYDEIMRKTRHSPFSIKRYIVAFGRMLLLLEKKITLIPELSRLLHQSERLTKEYLGLYEEHKGGDHWPKVYVELVEQLTAMYPAKKKTVAEGREK
jgi:DNA-binding CsgD family transcriptional regulator